MSKTPSRHNFLEGISIRSEKKRFNPITKQRMSRGRFQLWKCVDPNCGHEVYSDQHPGVIRWSDYHVCRFRKVPFNDQEEDLWRSKNQHSSSSESWSPSSGSSSSELHDHEKNNHSQWKNLLPQIPLCRWILPGKQRWILHPHQLKRRSQSLLPNGCWNHQQEIGDHKKNLMTKPKISTPTLTPLFSVGIFMYNLQGREIRIQINVIHRIPWFPSLPPHVNVNERGDPRRIPPHSFHFPKSGSSPLSSQYWDHDGTLVPSRWYLEDNFSLAIHNSLAMSSQYWVHVLNGAFASVIFCPPLPVFV